MCVWEGGRAGKDALGSLVPNALRKGEEDIIIVLTRAEGFGNQN